MMKFILGKKIGMTQIFDKNGNAIPVTVIEAGPCFVTQIKEEKKDGYKAIQIGFSELKPKKIKKSKKNKPYRWLQEFKIMNHETCNMKQGDKIDVSIFGEGDKIRISSTSKAKGFQGVVKRHGFSGGPATHGHRHVLRRPGSIGSSFPEKVFKGKKMAGRTGFKRITVKNLKVVFIDVKNNLLAIGGAVPGSNGSLVEIRSI